jgi:hypothetical protein
MSLGAVCNDRNRFMGQQHVTKYFVDRLRNYQLSKTELVDEIVLKCTTYYIWGAGVAQSL